MAATKARAAARKAARPKTAFGEHDQQLVGYQELAKAAGRDRDQAIADKAQAERIAGEALGNVDRLKADVAFLKGELAACHATIERQGGYLDRVREDDANFEGATRDVIEQRTHTEPKRPGPRVASRVVTIRAEAPFRGGYGGEVLERASDSKPWWMR